MIASHSTEHSRRNGRWIALHAVAVWSAVFAALHLYWAAGGRGGLGASTAEADAALQETWFAVYNLVVAVLATLGAVLALVLLRASGGSRLHRWARIAAILASATLFVRGAVGVTLLALEWATGSSHEQRPLVLLLIEPWFVIGGIAYAFMAYQIPRTGVTAAPDLHQEQP